jgi:predicted nucleic acid-binding protein
METKVLDAYAILAFLKDETGADAIHALLLQAEQAKISLAMSVVNLGEVWYAIARATSPAKADRYIQEIQAMAIDIVEADWLLTRQAAAFKANGNISYADCYAAALTKDRKAELITGDREFKALEGEINIAWI